MNPENDTEQSTLSTDFLCDAVRLFVNPPSQVFDLHVPRFRALHAFAVRDSFYVSDFLTIDLRMSVDVSISTCSLERR